MDEAVQQTVSNVQPKSENLSLPDIEIAGLRIWVHSCDFPNYDDRDCGWDDTFYGTLDVTTHCSSSKASFWDRGKLLYLTEIDRWLIRLERINDFVSGKENLFPKEWEEPETVKKYFKNEQFYFHPHLPPVLLDAAILAANESNLTVNVSAFFYKDLTVYFKLFFKATNGWFDEYSFIEEIEQIELERLIESCRKIQNKFYKTEDSN